MPSHPESTPLPPGLPSENQPPGRKTPPHVSMGSRSLSKSEVQYSPVCWPHSSHGIPEVMTGGRACPMSFTLGLEQAFLNPVPSGSADLWKRANASPALKRHPLAVSGPVSLCEEK